MPYVVRDKEGKVCSISPLQNTTFKEFLEDNAPDLLDYINRMLPIYKPFGIDEEPYINRRKLEYPKTSDQLDLIMKTLKYLKDNNVDIGPDGETLINTCQVVKDKIPKTWKPE